ncbi:hypothetical protein F4805DRAFT_423590 [Annulohypoxylon moriforme]|nr:hypothetical protein F4805DRAFT_423590 [Annulohypoxylon moriforme]
MGYTKARGDRREGSRSRPALFLFLFFFSYLLSDLLSAVTCIVVRCRHCWGGGKLNEPVDKLSTCQRILGVFYCLEPYPALNPTTLILIYTFLFCLFPFV